MNKIKFVIILLSLFLIGSCSHSDKHYEMRSPMEEIAREISNEEVYEEYEEAPDADASEYPAESYISSSAALENPADTTRSMIRTAHIKFKVADVIKSTYSIENIAVRQGGFVENSNLSSRIDNTKRTRIKKDSILVTSYYTISNKLTLRVPNTKLDTTLTEIAQFVAFMDYRVIEAKDVTLDLLSKRLEQNRLKNFDNRMKSAIGGKDSKLGDVSSSESNLLSKQAQADAAKLENMRILDKINFSTIELQLYQNQKIKYETIAREEEIKLYKTPFGTRLLDALEDGWFAIVEIFLFLVNIWSIILLGGIIFWVVRYWKRKRKLKKASNANNPN